MAKNLISRRKVLGAMATMPLIQAPFIRRASAAEFSLKIAHPLAPAHPTNVRLLEAAERVQKDTDGRVDLRIFPNGQLGGEVDLLNQVRSGAVEGYVIGGLVVSSVAPVAALDGTGFAFSDASKVWPAMDGKLGDNIRNALGKSNLYATRTVWDLGFREITSSVKPGVVTMLPSRVMRPAVTPASSVSSRAAHCSGGSPLSSFPAGTS